MIDRSTYTNYGLQDRGRHPDLLITECFDQGHELVRVDRDGYHVYHCDICKLTFKLEEEKICQ